MGFSLRRAKAHPGALPVSRADRVTKVLLRVAPPLIEGVAYASNAVVNIVERMRTKRREAKTTFTPLELAQYRFTCAVKSGTTSIHEGVSTLMREIGADEASIYLRKDGNGTLEHYMTTNGRQATADNRPPDRMAITAFDREYAFVSVPRKAGSRPTGTLFIFNMIPEDMGFSQKPTEAVEYRAAVPLLVVDEEGGLKKLGVLVLKGDKLQVRRSHLAGKESVKKVAVFITGAARVLSQIVNARFDPLTGLPRTPEFKAQLGSMIKKLRRKQNFALLSIDLDHFKRINDTYGHAVGNQVLRAFAQELSNSVRGEKRNDGTEAVDLVFRTGGEEFAIILPGADIETACMIAERVRKRIESTPFRISEDETVSLTASIGAVDARTVMNGRGRRDRHLGGTMVDRGDQALYLIKNGGRNGVACIRREGKELEAAPYIP